MCDSNILSVSSNLTGSLWNAIVLRAHQCPLCFPALGVVLSVMVADSHTLVSIVTWVICLIGSFLIRRSLAVLVLAFSYVMLSLHTQRVKRQDMAVEAVGSWGEHEVVVSGEFKNGKAFGEILDGDFKGVKTQLWFSPSVKAVEVGDSLAIEGQWIEPRIPLNPNVFDEKSWLYRRGVSAVFVVRHMKVTNRNCWWMLPKRWALDARELLKERLMSGLNEESDEAKVILGMSLGMRPEGRSGLLDDFRNSGSIHVFAVSGLHVMMVGGIVALLLRLLGLPRKVLIPCVVVAMLFYALVTGMKPSAMRASIMGTIVLGAWLVQRRIVLGNSIAVGFILVLLWDGHLLFQPGFQLSFGVLIAIALLGNVLLKIYGWMTKMDPFLPRVLYSRFQVLWLSFRSKVQAGVIVATAAWCGSAPLTFSHFGLIAPISILASLPLVFCLFLVLSCSLASLTLGSIHSSISSGFNMTSSKVAAISLDIADTASSVRGGHVIERKWSQGERIVFYALPDGGSAVYVGVGGGTLIDCGGVRSFRREVLPSFLQNGASVDSVVLTHVDAQHCGGALELMTQFPIKQIVLPEQKSTSRIYRSIQTVIKKNGIRLAAPKGRLQLSGDCYIEVLYGGENEFSKRGVSDDSCLVLRLIWQDISFLLVNDAGFAFEQHVHESSEDWSADVLVLGRHIRDAAVSNEFINRINPNWLIDNENCTDRDDCYSLSKRGALIFEYDGDQIKMVSVREGEITEFDEEK